MVTIQTRLEPKLLLMSSLFSSHVGSKIRFRPNEIRGFCAPALGLKDAARQVDCSKKGAVIDAPKARVRVLESQLKENWLESLFCPFPGKDGQEPIPGRGEQVGDGLELDPMCVIGVDPDVSGALAFLRTDDSGSVCSAQVFDNPHLNVVIGKRVRKRLDARSIVHLLRSLDAPLGTTAYIEQSNPFPHDGKQGWWSGGFTYGLWLGILVASGFSVVPVYSRTWKDHFKLSRSSPSKDDSRKAASALFPSLCSSLKRKKDHGRAEALLIAAYGKGLRLQPDMDATEDCTSTMK